MKRILRTSSEISTPEKLAALIADQSVLRYKDAEEEPRRIWLGMEILALCMILHYQPPKTEDIEIDSTFADQMIMADDGISCLKREEMEEAFRRGIAGEYGEFYGITATTLVGFLRAWKKGEKRAQAISLLYKENQKELKEGDARFWATLAKAKEDGLIDIPDFQHSPFEDDKQRLERLERQRQEILKRYNG